MASWKLDERTANALGLRGPFESEGGTARVFVHLWPMYRRPLVFDMRGLGWHVGHLASGYRQLTGPSPHFETQRPESPRINDLCSIDAAGTGVPSDCYARMFADPPVFHQPGRCRVACPSSRVDPRGRHAPLRSTHVSSVSCVEGATGAIDPTW